MEERGLRCSFTRVYGDSSEVHFFGIEYHKVTDISSVACNLGAGWFWPLLKGSLSGPCSAYQNIDIFVFQFAIVINRDRQK